MACNWQAPPKGYLKMNTDASCMGSPGTASYGGIFRDESGGWIKGFHGKLPGLCTPLEAEMWAIIKGLKVVEKLGFRKVLVETDSVAAMQLFSFQELHQNHAMKDVIKEGVAVLLEHECVIVHTRREGNQCADKLAELGGRQVRECNVIHMPPPEVVKLLLKDRFGENWRKITRCSEHPFWAVPLKAIESYCSGTIKSSPVQNQHPVCAPLVPLQYQHPVCAPLMPRGGLSYHQQRLGGNLQLPRMVILH